MRLNSLTSLRFFAAFSVLIGHVSAVYLGGSPLQTITSVNNLGVQFFFALSGFVLTWSFNPRVPTRNFYGRRVARIYPLHVVMAVIALGLFIVQHRSILALPTTLNFLLLQTWPPVDYYVFSLNSVSWSLCCEAFFYLCLPLLARWALRAHRRRAPIVITSVIFFIVIVASFFPYSSHIDDFLYTDPAYRLGGFALGVLLAAAMRAGYRTRVSLPVAVGIALAGYATSVVWTVVGRHLGITILVGQTDAIFLLPALLLIASAASADLTGSRWAFRSRVLVRLGEASFALYITHWVLLGVVNDFLPHPHGAAGSLAVTVGFCLVAIAVSLVAYTWYERPAERLVRRLIGTPKDQKGRETPSQPISAEPAPEPLL